MASFPRWRVSKLPFRVLTPPNTQSTFSSSAFAFSRFLPFIAHYLERLGGMCGAIVTSPFDVVKTRLQSSLFREKHTTVGLAGNGVVVIPRRSNLLYNFVETGHILRYAEIVSSAS